MWQMINCPEDILRFMSQFNNFHDSCVKELSYVSGSYVLPDLSMYPLNDLRKLNLILQKQSLPSTVELEFQGLRKLHLTPSDPAKFTSEILGWAMYYNYDGCIILSDEESSSVEHEQYESFYICAQQVRWRSLPDE